MLSRDHTSSVLVFASGSVLQLPRAAMLKQKLTFVPSERLLRVSSDTG